MDDINAQLIAVQAKLAKDPTNPDLLSLKEDLIQFLSLSEETAAELEQSATNKDPSQQSQHANDTRPSTHNRSKDGAKDSQFVAVNSTTQSTQLSDLERKRKEKNRKKRAKLQEKHKELSEIAESEAQSWQSFACKKGLKGVTKRSIFASPCSAKGKVGVGTNGIADAPSAAAQPGSASSASSRRK